MRAAASLAVVTALRYRQHPVDNAMSRAIHFPAAVLAAVAQGNRIEAIKRLRQANHGLDLRGAMEAIDACAAGDRDFSIADSSPSASIGSDHGLPAEAIDALARGQVIAATKIVRQVYGLGLKEAKDRVDGYRAGAVSPDIAATRGDRQASIGRLGAKDPKPASAQRVSTVAAGDGRANGWWLTALLVVAAGAWFWLG